MTKLSFTRTLLAAFAAAALAGASIASADDQRLDDAWGDLVLDQEPILSEAQFAKMNNLAFQAAVTKICDGYQLDQTKFSEGLADATFTDEVSDLTPDEMKQWETAVYFRLGASYGLFLAEGNAHVDSFCASAAELKADSTVPNYWQ